MKRILFALAMIAMTGPALAQQLTAEERDTRLLGHALFRNSVLICDTVLDPTKLEGMIHNETPTGDAAYGDDLDIRTGEISRDYKKLWDSSGINTICTTLQDLAKEYNLYP